MSLQLLVTADGSHSLYNTALKEVYHSRNGAMAESEHVFIRAGYEHQCSTATDIKVLEVGFGTGLNALLTCLRAKSDKIPLEYVAFEPFPVDGRLIEQLNYCDLLNDDAGPLWQDIHKAPWGERILMGKNISLMKTCGRIEDHNLPTGHFNLVYFDAFAPDVQAELWETDLFRKIYHSMTGGGTLVTYSARGAVRRSLIAAGFSVERLAGPSGKREMLRAVKQVSG